MTATDKTPAMVAFTLDFETGGLKPQTSACTQIAIHATRLDNFERVGSYMAYIAPYTKKDFGGPKKKVLRSKLEAPQEKLMDYKDEALTYSNISFEMLESKGRPIEEVAVEVCKFIEDHTPEINKGQKPFLIGQNIEFDKGFFMQLMEYGGVVKEVKKHLRGIEDFYGNWQPLVLDTIILGQLAFADNPLVKSYALEKMCENLGVELDDAHDADADVSATTNVVGVLAGRMRNLSAGGEEFGISKTEKTREHFKI